MTNPDTALPNLAPPIALALAGNFGSVPAWAADLRATAQAQGHGEVRLDFIARDGTLAHRGFADAAPRADATTLFAMPLPGAADAFIAGIDWPAAYERYQHAVQAASAGLEAHEPGTALLIDVRRAGVFDAAPTMLPGARWRDPATLPAWAAELPRNRPVVVYCVYGHEVGRSSALRLRALGVDARFLEGGIDAWQAAGRATVTREKLS